MSLGVVSGSYQPSSNYSQVILQDAPIAYYHLDETTGTTLVDSSGNSRNGVWSGVPQFGASGALALSTSPAVTFDGATYGNIPAASWMDVPNASLETWFKSTDTGINTVGGRLVSSSHMMTLDLQPSLDVRATAATSEGGTTFVRVTIPSSRDGQWHHIVNAYDGTTLKLYFDGELAGSVPLVGTLRPTTADLRIARRGDSSRFFRGQLDEFAFYDYALQPERVRAHYNAARMP